MLLDLNMKVYIVLIIGSNDVDMKLYLIVVI